MGNTTSMANNRPPTARTDPTPPHQQHQHRPHSTSSSSYTTHPSLRSKKKSLELPDLASLALSPSHPYSGSSQHTRTHPTSSPIPIPISPHVNPSPRGRHQPQFPSTQQMPDVYIPQPSTHIPIPPYGNKARANQHIRGAPLPYTSTRSFTTRGQPHPQPRTDKPPPPFVPETVHSTIPIALTKRKQEMIQPHDGKLPKSNSPGDDSHEPVSVKIVWRGGGKSVILARAGDDNWKGRLPLEREYVPFLSTRLKRKQPVFIVFISREPTSDQVWFVWVTLPKGTHHFRFLVDDQWRVADDLPTAVDDEGSLANYVGVALFTPPTTSTMPPPASPPPKLQPGQSFWSTSSTGDGSTSGPDDRKLGPPRWTSDFPPELLAAAREEENYLVSSSSVPDSASASGLPAPNIPPAPTLPRFLDKLILNVKPNAIVPAPTRTRDREREDRRPSRKLKPSLGMTGTATGDTNGAPDAGGRGGSAPARTRLYAPGLADDASVLPVPSHVVLHHLSTSAIRNGVLAVGNTTRYRKKVGN